MSVESNKTLGGVGALLIAIGSIVPLLSLVGIIIVLIALKGLATAYNENSIFQNALYGVIFGVVAIVTAAVVLVGAFFGGVWFMATTPDLANPLAFLGAVILALVIMFVFYLLMAIFFKKSFDVLADKSGERMFGTGGLLLLLGAVLTIVLIGVILLLVAWILIAVGFFSIKPAVAQPPPQAPAK